MKIITLIENSKLENNEDLVAEHGFSLHISRNGRQVLFDTGASDSFYRNAKQMGVDIQAVDMAVISHHHFDHGGGLSIFLKSNQKAKVYLRSRVDGDCYFRAFGIVRKYIGLDKDLFQMYPDRFIFVDEFTEIAPDIFIFTKIGSSYPLPKGNRYLYLQKGSKRILDPFEHELIMVIKEEDGLVIFTGCSHNGMFNMIETVANHFQGFPIKAVIGGFHLVGLPMFNTMAGSKRDVNNIGEEMLRFHIEKVYTGHCTGSKAYQVLKRILGKKLEYLHTGSNIEI